jgi:hypothetical protein
MAQKTRKLRGGYPALEAALDRLGLTHVLVTLPNASTPAAVRTVIEAGRSVLPRSQARGRRLSSHQCCRRCSFGPVPFAAAYLNRGAPAIVEARDLYQAGAIGSLHAGYLLALGSPGYRAAGMTSP